MKSADKIFDSIKTYVKKTFRRNDYDKKAAVTACYIYEKGFDYFKIGKDKVDRVLNGRVSFVNKVFGKNVLIIGKELSFYLRSKYPPTGDKNLMGMISNELDELFPMITSPAFYFHVFEKHENYVLVDIWAWESRIASQIADQFPYNYTVPEDVLFKSADYEISVLQNHGKTFLIAHGPEGFIGTRVFIRDVSQKDMETFIRGLGAVREKIKLIRVSKAASDIGKGFSLTIPIVETEPKDYPLVLDNIAAFNLGPFLSKPWYSGLDIDFVMRVSAYSFVCYMISTYISLNRLDNTALELQSKISETNKKVMLLAEVQSKDITSKVLTALAAKVKETTPPLEVLDALAVASPQGDRYQQIQITNRNVSAMMLTLDPATAIKSLSTNPAVEFVQLVGEPQKDAKNTYKINLSITISDKDKLEQALMIQKNIVTASLPSIKVGDNSVNTLKAPSTPQPAIKTDNNINSLKVSATPQPSIKPDSDIKSLNAPSTPQPEINSDNKVNNSLKTPSSPQAQFKSGKEF
ncbi:hypothetical protein [Candidatus Magnetomonas plexicatena]|uniref:hypothetical protein n=1 Tax=Candidatus Magnetomonas plexicatena TaxID=2552947 RepID=UPI0011018B5C|nr:hypothetical protein E2O03_001520 [Nitrospirales bacterium LBB_01]